MYVSFSAYVTRFLFTLCTNEDYDYGDVEKCEKSAIQPSEICCHHGHFSAVVDCESCQHLLCSGEHEQSTAISDDCQSSRNKHSVEHVYDDDGDVIVRRNCRQQFEVIYIG